MNFIFCVHGNSKSQIIQIQGLSCNCGKLAALHLAFQIDVREPGQVPISECLLRKLPIFEYQKKGILSHFSAASSQTVQLEELGGEQVVIGTRRPQLFII